MDCCKPKLPKMENVKPVITEEEDEAVKAERELLN
jgi:hypothetical protein